MDKVTLPSAPADAIIPPEQLPEVRNPGVWIGSPAYGGRVELDWMNSLLTTLFHPDGQCVGDLQFFGGDSLVSRARNNLVSIFLEGRDMNARVGDKEIMAHVKFDWLFFVDTDLIFKPSDIKMLYDLAVKSGPGIYAGTYPLKTLRPKVVFNARPNSKLDADGVVSVSEAGTGFMMIHRDVFVKMQAAFPENDFKPDGGDHGGSNPVRHDWFQVGVKRDINGNNPRYLSEDYYFCRKWIDMGGDVLMQTKICANHIGSFRYPADPNEIIAIAEIYQKAAAARPQNGLPAQKIASAA